MDQTYFAETTNFKILFDLILLHLEPNLAVLALYYNFDFDDSFFAGPDRILSADILVDDIADHNIITI